MVTEQGRTGGVPDNEKDLCVFNNVFCLFCSKEHEESRGAPYKEKGLEHRVVVEGRRLSGCTGIPPPGWL